MTHRDAAAPLAARLSYAQCWEDAAVLQAALQLGPGDRVLSVASAGCNSLALALRGAQVTGIDLSPPQLALCELKLAGGQLSYPRFLQLLGLGPGDPLDAYRELEPRLSAGCRGYWAHHQQLLAAGVLGAGRFERYLATFRRRILSLIHSRARIQGLIDAKSPTEQRAWHDKHWSSWRWRGLFRLFFSRLVMARLGRSPEQFAQVQGAVADRILARCDAVLGGQDLGENFYVQWILEGAWRDIRRSHPYLSPAGHAGLAQAAERLRWICAPLETHLPACEPHSYTAFNLSNIGEYLPTDTWEQLYAQLVRAGAPGARLAYWNLFVPRRRPAALAARVLQQPERSAALLARDRVPFYGAFVLEILR